MEVLALRHLSAQRRRNVGRVHLDQDEQRQNAFDLSAAFDRAKTRARPSGVCVCEGLEEERPFSGRGIGGRASSRDGEGGGGRCIRASH